MLRTTAEVEGEVTGLSPPVILCYRSFQGDTSVAFFFCFMSWSLNFLCCWRLVYVFIFLCMFFLTINTLNGKCILGGGLFPFLFFFFFFFFCNPLFGPQYLIFLRSARGAPYFCG